MATLILVSGEEEFLVERAARDEARMALAGEVCEYSLPGDLDRYLFESQARVIDESARAFIAWGAKDVPPLPEGRSDVLVVVSGKPIADPRAKRSVNYPKLKDFDDKNEVIGWILKEGESHNIDLSRVARALFVNSGNCLRKLASEIAKIAAAVPPGAVVSPDDARPLMCFSAELSPRDVIQAVCNGNAQQALAYHDKLQERNDETGWILAYLQRLVIQQLRMESLCGTGLSDDEVASRLGVHPYVYRKSVAVRRGRWRPEVLTSSLDALCEADLSHKRGQDFAKFSLQLEIIRLCEEATKNVQR